MSAKVELVQRVVHHARRRDGRPDPVVMARERMPARTRRLASLSVARSPASAAERRRRRSKAPRGRLEHGGLARAGRSHQVDRQDPVLEEVLAVVRGACSSLRARMRCVHVERNQVWRRHSHSRDTSRHLQFNSFAARSRRRRRGAPARCTSRQRRNAPRPMAALAARTLPTRRDAVDGKRGALADGALAKHLERRGEQRAVDARQSRRWTPPRDARAPLRAPTAAATDRPATGRWSTRASPGSKPRRAFGEEGVDALREVRAVGDAREVARAPGRDGSRAGPRRRPGSAAPWRCRRPRVGPSARLLARRARTSASNASAG